MEEPKGGRGRRCSFLATRCYATHSLARVVLRFNGSLRSLYYLHSVVTSFFFFTDKRIFYFIVFIFFFSAKHLRRINYE